MRFRQGFIEGRLSKQYELDQFFCFRLHVGKQADLFPQGRIQVLRLVNQYRRLASFFMFLDQEPVHVQDERFFAGDIGGQSELF